MRDLEINESLKPSESALPATVAHAPAQPPRLLDFLAGLPALIAVFGMLAILALSVINPPTAAQYTKESKRRLEQGDVKGALVCARRVLSMNPGDSENRYNLITLVAREGDFQKADSMAMAMVDMTKTQYERRIKEEGGFAVAQAHLYLAERYSVDTRSLAQNAGRIEEHINLYLRACKDTNRTKEARGAERMLGLLYAQTGPFPRAREYLEKTKDNDPMTLFKLGYVCDRLKDRLSAEGYYKSSIDAAERMLAESPLNDYARVTEALSLASLARYQDARDLLGKGYLLSQEDKTKQKYHSMMATICLDQLRSIKPDPKNPRDTKLAERLKLMQEGLDFDPNNFELVVEVSKMMDQGGKEAEEAKKILNAMVAEGKSAGLCHFFLGNDAWKHDKVDVARTHWEAAFKLEPRMVLVANNLAYVLAFSETPDTKRALSIVDQLLNTSNFNPSTQAQLQGTRGQILAKMGNWKEALTSLEASLKEYPKSEGIHTSLALTYENLGMADLAAEHKRIAEELSKLKTEKK